MHQKLLSMEECFVHDKCYKTYTAAKNVARAQKSSADSSDSVPKLCSSSTPYNYPTHCLICTKELDHENVRRHSDRYSCISNIEVVSRDERESVMQKTILMHVKKEMTVRQLTSKHACYLLGISEQLKPNIIRRVCKNI